jgi:O-antigen/teichoic acid export membrane protein
LARVTEDSARGGFFLFSGAAMATVIMAIAAILVGRLLGPELYGQYNLVLVVPTLLVLLTDLGINAGITRFAASLRAEGKGESVPGIVRYGMYFRLLIGIIVSFLSLVFANYLTALINRPDFTFYVQIASISTIFQVIFGTANSAFVGLDKSEYNALTTNIQATAKTVLQILLVLLGFNVTGALIGYVGGFIVASILGAIILFFRLLKPAEKSKADPPREGYSQVLKLLARYGMPIYVSVVLAGLLPLYQQVVLAFFASDAAIGNFRAAANFLTLLSIVPSSITTALLPAFSKLDSSRNEKVNVFFKRANKYTCLLIVPTTTLIVLFSKQIVQIIYGSGYTSASFFLSLSSLVYFLVIIGHLSLTSLFNGIGETRLTLKVTMINFLILLILSPVLAAVYDVVGAIIAALIASISAASYSAYVAARKLKVQFDFGPTLRIYAISIFSSAIPLLLLFFTSLHSVIVLVAGTISYLMIFITLMPLAGIASQNELKTLMQVTSKIPILKYVTRPVLEYQRRVTMRFGGSRKSATPGSTVAEQ